ncbi:hypothetical protein ONE63_004769 [Megalurothrips usitatus]|uniref:Uncharacterized protein n=1 Tax=Megalurothrips usitatus TaxID=439358 RepID=A0AAV7X3X3_9NEOP|nr:hypothetical protein ONE63_004769 [Megalurothrips usitatus]
MTSMAARVPRTFRTERRSDGRSPRWAVEDAEDQEQDLSRLRSLLDKIQDCHRQAIDQGEARRGSVVGVLPLLTGDGPAVTGAAADADVVPGAAGEALEFGWTPGQDTEYTARHGVSAVGGNAADVQGDDGVVYLHDNRGKAVRALERAELADSEARRQLRWQRFVVELVCCSSTAADTDQDGQQVKWMGAWAGGGRAPQPAASGSSYQLALVATEEERALSASTRADPRLDGVLRGRGSASGCVRTVSDVQRMAFTEAGDRLWANCYAGESWGGGKSGGSGGRGGPDLISGRILPPRGNALIRIRPGSSRRGD